MKNSKQQKDKNLEGVYERKILWREKKEIKNDLIEQKTNEEWKNQDNEKEENLKGVYQVRKKIYQEWNRKGKYPKKENEWKINEIQIKETNEEI